ncbi:hypothetical protein HK102_002725 [Quaeritorhiza haematococci]|nr:hypothetical protein HK102_002725 [Quaeritorhiza haematococci]
MSAKSPTDGVPPVLPIEGKREPTMGVMSAIFYVAGAMIGAGIFATPSGVLEQVGSVGVAMFLWVIGGSAALLGALSYIEWGQMFPGQSGGDQVYFLYGYPRPRALMAFLFCWTGIFLILPGYAASISTVSAKYFLNGIFGQKDDDLKTTNSFMYDHWDLFNKLTAVLIITLIHITNAVSVRLAVRVNDFLGALKIALLATFVVAGIVVMTGVTSLKMTDNLRNPWGNVQSEPSSFVSALFAIFYVYDGWNSINYAAGELKNPVRALPLGSIGGVLICMLLYVLVNIAFLAVVPYDEFINAKELLGSVFAAKVFGRTIGEKVMPFLIASCAYGACSTAVFGAARIIQAAAAQGMLPKPDFFKRNNSLLNTPLNALLLNFLVAALLICAPPGEKAFNFLIGLVTYPAWIFYGISLVGLLMFRRLRPNWPRPFKIWLVAPIIVICVALFVTIFPFFGPDWLPSLVGLVVMLFGIPVYYLIRGRFTLDDMELKDGMGDDAFPTSVDVTAAGKRTEKDMA